MTETQSLPIAVVCGSDTLVGGALVARLVAEGTAVVTLDFPQAGNIDGAQLQLHGDLLVESAWTAFAAALRERGLVPTSLVSTLHRSDAPLEALDLPQERWDDVSAHTLRSAYLACRHMMPLMRRGGAIVLLASVYPGYDVRAEGAAQSAAEAGLLALARALALSGGPNGIRVNTICYGLLAEQEQVAQEPRLRRAARRIPLGRATSYDDVVDAILFLISADASYLTGSILVVDGGQSLQSWSNAPDEPDDERVI
jgi:NAD(P)-dependent dehydrogenase (short-subunit alcohol dehydrogenase family)